jgi:hypothetical protein
MFIQPSLNFSNIDLPIPAGQAISIGSTGNEATTVQLQAAYPGQQWLYTTLATLNNSAQTFGPYGQDRTIRIQNRSAEVEYDIGAQPILRGFPALVLNSTTPVSIVEPAATFTTLTYDNNAGKVRLNSAGAHGLTAAVAVGASVYATWTGGTGVTGLYPVTALDTDTTGTAVTIDLAYVASTVTITIAAPGVVTWTAHGLSVNDTIRFTTTGALPTGLAINTTYYVKTVLSANTFTVSTSAGGAAVTTSGTQSGTQTALVWYGTAVVAVANTVLTLGSVVIPAWSMGLKGGMIVNAQFSMTNTANAKNIGMSYGGSAISAVAGTSNASVSIQKDVYNRSNGTLVTSALAATGHGLNGTATVVITEDTTLDQVFLITAQPAVANNVVTLEGYNVICSF